jgi:broad specificity phosphatase PhoE
VETSLAMDFAVDETCDMAGDLWEAGTQEKGDHHAQWDWGQEAFTRYAKLIAADGPTAALGRRQVKLWTSVLARLPPHGAGLLISHGGLIQPGLVTLRPRTEHQSWGEALGHCEGARLRFEDIGAVQVELIRQAQAW